VNHDIHDILATADQARLQGLMFNARELVNGLYAGRHGSRRRGSGLEFHDYRAYCPGDEVAGIDWKLFGRTDRYYLRRHRQLTDQQVYIMVDRTASMNFPTPDLRNQATPAPATKLAHAKTLAAAIAMLTIGQNDRIGLGLFSNQLDHHVPMGSTWNHLQELCRVLEQSKPAASPGNLSTAIAQMLGLVRYRGLIVLIADLLDDPQPLLEGLNQLRHARFDVIVFQVLTTLELDLTPLGNQSLQVVDAETHQTLVINPSQMGPRYRCLMSKHLGAIRNTCGALGIDHNLVTTDQPAVDALRHYLTRRVANRS